MRSKGKMRDKREMEEGRRREEEQREEKWGTEETPYLDSCSVTNIDLHEEDDMRLIPVPLLRLAYGPEHGTVQCVVLSCPCLVVQLSTAAAVTNHPVHRQRDKW